jgi:DNA-binding transcriptional MerR regulator
MTIDEASKTYNIPLEILREYESWGLCGTVKRVMGAWQYDDVDLERLSMIMTLHDIGFENSEVETYMRLLLEGDGTEAERMRMLNRKRTTALDEIHWKQKQLDRLDYLRHKIQKANNKKL